MFNNRYEPADPLYYRMVNKLVQKYFSEAEDAEFLLLMDSKKVTKSGRLVFARIKKANEEIRTLTATDDNPDGVDYVIYMDKTLFTLIDTKDKRRILFHELKHMRIKETPQETDRRKIFNVVGHEFEGFHDELWYNKDDPHWQERVGTVLAEAYGLIRREEEEEEENE